MVQKIFAGILAGFLLGGAVTAGPVAALTAWVAGNGVSSSVMVRAPKGTLRAALLLAATLAPVAARAAGTPAPPFPTTAREAWIGEPATWQTLRGKVVLLEVWTFG